MPFMDGITTVKWINEQYPLVKILVVSMIEKEEVIVSMLKLGVKGYLCKDVEPKELGEALNAIMDKGFLLYRIYYRQTRVHSSANRTIR